MNSLSNVPTTASPAAEVQSFVYEATDGSAFGSEVSGHGDPQTKSKGGLRDSLPRISEEELARLISTARSEGIREGEARVRSGIQNELVQERSRIADILAAFQQERKEYYSRVEVELVHFALAIAAKILHREAQVDRMVVAGLVKIALEKLQQGTRVTVRVQPEVAESWRQYFHDNPTVQIAEDSSVGPHGCLLQTEVGTVQMGFDVQLKEIEKGFFDLLAQKPELK